MDNLEMEIDVDSIKDLEPHHPYLTEIRVNENNDLVAKFTVKGSNNDLTSEEYVFVDNAMNQELLLKKGLETLVSLIECHEKEVFNDIINRSSAIDDARIKYLFNKITSIVCLPAAIAIGFSISNYDSDNKSMLIALIASLGIAATGIYTHYKFKVEKNNFNNKRESLRDFIFEKSKNYVRVKE